MQLAKKKYAFTGATTNEDSPVSSSRWKSQQIENDDADQDEDDDELVNKFFSQRSGGTDSMTTTGASRSLKSKPDDSWLFRSDEPEERAKVKTASTVNKVATTKASDIDRRFADLKRLAAASSSRRALEAQEEEEEDVEYRLPAKKTASGLHRRSSEDYERSSMASSSQATRTSQGKRVRPKPDLGNEEPEEESLAREEEGSAIGRGLVVLKSTTARAPAKEPPIRYLKRQRDLERLANLEDEHERKRLLEQKKQDLRDMEQRRLKDKYWMREFLEGARRSSDDRGAGMKVILRKEILQDGAEQHITGKNLFHNQFLAQPNAVAGRFYVEPTGSKPTELNGEDTSLYFFVEKTGAEGFILRVDKKYYELFEGDVAIIPPDSAYSFVNPSKSTLCQFTYMLIPVATAPPPPAYSASSSGKLAGSSSVNKEDDKEDDVNEDELFSYDFRGIKNLGQKKDASSSAT